MKFQLLPSSFESDGTASERQHLACFVIDDTVAIDGGSLAMGCSDVQRAKIRDVILTHTHLDHIAGLPLFIDDLFSTLTEPIRIHATEAMIECLERDIFNWSIYPRFSEIASENGHAMTYVPYAFGSSFEVAHLDITAIPVNHSEPSAGFIISDGKSAIGITGDTSGTSQIWAEFERRQDLSAVLVECAFSDEMGELAKTARHLTPSKLAMEIAKLEKRDYPVYVINIKPMFRDRVITQISSLGVSDLHILKVGQVYDL